jgi:hypothetical protein
MRFQLLPSKENHENCFFLLITFQQIFQVPLQHKLPFRIGLQDLCKPLALSDVSGTDTGASVIESFDISSFEKRSSS